MQRDWERKASKVYGDAEGDEPLLPMVPLPQRLPSKPVAIADMANMFGVTHRTLHFYEEKKLLQPTRQGAMRIYSPHQVRVMAIINLCRETGMSVVQIQELLAELAEAASQSECDRLFHAALKSRKKELLAEESLIRRQMQQINEILDDESDSEARHGSNSSRMGAPFLSDFEQRCLVFMAEGYTPARIANITDKPLQDILTIEAAIIRKFGSSNRFQAVAKAVLFGMFEEQPI